MVRGVRVKVAGILMRKVIVCLFVCLRASFLRLYFPFVSCSWLGFVRRLGAS